MTNPEDIEVAAIVIQTRAELVASRHHRHTRQGQQSCVPTILLMSPSNSPTGARRRHFATGTPSCSAVSARLRLHPHHRHQPLADQAKDLLFQRHRAPRPGSGLLADYLHVARGGAQS
jgi:hypothetical protein